MRKTVWTFASIATIAILVMGVFVMPTPTPEENGFVADDTGLRPGTAALRATINPETGEVEISSKAPKSTLDIQTVESLRRDTEGLKPVVHPNGAVSVNLEGRFQSVSVARVDKNGKRIVCTEDADEINRVLHEETTADSENAQTPEVR